MQIGDQGGDTIKSLVSNLKAKNMAVAVNEMNLLVGTVKSKLDIIVTQAKKINELLKVGDNSVITMEMNTSDGLKAEWKELDETREKL